MPNYAINQNYAGVMKITPAYTAAPSVWRVDVRFKLNVLDAWSVLINHTPNRFLTVLQVRFFSGFFGRDEVTFRVNSVDYKFNAPNASQTFSDGEYHNLSFICDGATLTCYRDGTQLASPIACTAALSQFDCFGDARDLAQNSSLEYVKVYESVDTSALVHNWDANVSDTSNTGLAPVLVDSVASRNAVGGAAFPTDGTAWLSYTPPPDVTPDIFTFTALTGQALNSSIESNAITVEGVDAATDINISITGGEYRVSTDSGATWGAYSTSTGTVQLNYQVQVRQTSSANQGTLTTATLDIGGVTADFNVTTLAPPAMTLDQATASHGDTLTFTSEMTGGTSAKLVDGSLNELALVDFVNNLDGTYSAKIPDLVDGLVGVEIGTLSVVMTNGVDDSTDTFDLVPLTGFSQISVAEQSGALQPHDWGYVGVGGLANAAALGDTLWNKDIAGLDPALNGLYIFDFSVFTPPQTSEAWLQDADTLTWSYISTEFLADGGSDLTKPVITLTGASTINLTVGDTYTEQGATWTDNVDGSGSVTNITGTVSTGVAGSYTRYYNHTDAAGNAADEVTRNIVVANDVTPDVPNLGANVTDAEPNAYVTRSFVTSGISTAIDWTATGDAQVSLSPASGFGNTVTAGNGTTIYVRLRASATLGGVVSGGVAGDSFSVTTTDTVVEPGGTGGVIGGIISRIIR